MKWEEMTSELDLDKKPENRWTVHVFKERRKKNFNPVPVS